MNRVLLTSVGRRVYLADFFTKSFGSERIVVADADPSAPAMHAGIWSQVLPPLSAIDYVDKLAEVVERRDIGLVASLHDGEAALLARYRDRLPTGIVICGMQAPVWELGLDKLRTAEYLEESGVLGPKTLPMSEATSAIEYGEFSFPLVSKPRRGSASEGVTVLENLNDLASLIMQHKDSLDQHIVQPLVPGQEYGLDVVNDFQGRYCGVLARKKLSLRGGETDDALTVAPDRFSYLAQSVSELTRHVGLVDVDVIDDGSNIHVIDINPRFGGGLSVLPPSWC